MLGGMRLQVEVRRDDEDPLRRMALDNGYPIRLWASELLHEKIREEVARLDSQLDEPHELEVA
jgi:hypothetical protein